MAQRPAQVAFYRVDIGGGEGYTFPCLQLLNRRGGGAPVLLRWVYQRSLELLLFRRTDGGSTGAIWKLLNNTGLQSTSFKCDRQAVKDELLTDGEFNFILTTFRQSLPPEQHDPSSLGRIRSCTLLPIATAAALCRHYGRSPYSIAFLRAFNEQVPTVWEMEEQADEDQANLRHDLILHDKLDEHGFEAEEMTLAEELTAVPEFCELADDETKLRSYALTPNAALKRQLAKFVAHRTATFAARRAGGAVQSVSAEANCTSLLRFLGWMQRTNNVPAGATLDITFLARPDLGDKAQDWAEWLEGTQECRFTSICNYLSSLVSITNYVYFELDVEDDVVRLSPNPLEQLVNLRDQAHGAIKEQNMYTPANIKGGFITWPEAQEVRVKVVAGLSERPPTSTVKEAVIVSLMTLIPPDRVGVIRRLRFKHTLKRGDKCWVVDLSKRSDGHKTSKHYGPFHGELPVSLNGVLDSYANLLELEFGGDEAYLFSPHDGMDRPLESSAWSAAVKRVFKKHHGQEIAPKTLRSSFITWLRDQTTCPEILRSAAHAQKHSERRQASNSYDAERDTRLCKAAYEFNSSFAARYEMPSVNTAASLAVSPLARPQRSTAAASGAGSSTRSPAAAFSVLDLVKCNHDDCMALATESLRICKCAKAFHPSCAIKAGCRPDKLMCALCLSFEPLPANLASKRTQASAPAAATTDEEDSDEEDGNGGGSDGWKPLSGGPWFAKLARPARQPDASASYRVFYVEVPFDPVDTDLTPGGEIRFPVVPGAPAEGLIFRVPSYSGNSTSFIFTMKLSKNGCSARSVTINRAEHRERANVTEDEDEGGDRLVEDDSDDDDDDAPLGSAPAVVPLSETPGSLFAPPRSRDVDDEHGSDSNATRARENAFAILDANSPSKAAWAELTALPAPPPAEEDPPEPPQPEEEPPAQPPPEQPSVEEDPPEPPPPEEQQMSEPPPPEEKQVSVPPPSRHSTRKRKAKAMFGDNGELDGPASSFRSAPEARKASTDPSAEMDVPSFASPGETVWAMGLHCGVRKRFKAKVVKVRKQFPRIVVKYVATESGGTHPLELPDPVTAYLTMTDLEPDGLLIPA